MTVNILTDTAAVFSADDVFTPAKTNATPRVPTDSWQYVIAQWGNQIDASLLDVNAFFQGDSPAGKAGKTAALLGGVSIAEDLLVAGAVTADLGGAAGMAVGSSSEAATTVAIKGSAVGVTSLLFSSPTDADVGGLVYDHTDDTLTLRAEAADVASLTASALLPASHVSKDLGASALRWRDVYADDVDAKTSVTAGNGGAAAYVNLNGGPGVGEEGRLVFKASGSTRGQLYFDTGSAANITGNGLVVPKLTSAQRTALSPVSGQVVWDTSFAALYAYDGTDWQTFNLTGADTSTFTRAAICDASIAVGDCVYITGNESGGKLSIALCDITSKATMPAWGVVIEKPTATTAVVQAFGEIDVSGMGLTIVAGLPVYVGTDGRPTTTQPAHPATGDRYQWQAIGLASDANKILIAPESHTTQSGDPVAVTSGDVFLTAEAAYGATLDGHDLWLTSGNGGATSGSSGDVTVRTGTVAGGSTRGRVILDGSSIESSADHAFAGSILTDGAVASDAFGDYDDVVIGDGTGNHGITIFTGNTSIGGIYFTDTAASFQGAVYYSHNANALYFGAGAGYRVLIRSDGLHPNTDNTYDLGSTAGSPVRWRNIYAATSIYAPALAGEPGSGAGSGTALAISGGVGGATGNGANLTLDGGDAGGGNGNGGWAYLRGGDPSGTGTPGRVVIIGADAAIGGGGDGAKVSIGGGAGDSGGDGGNVEITAGDGNGAGVGGDVIVTAGGTGSGNGGNVQIFGGTAGAGGQAGSVLVSGQAGSTTTTTPGGAFLTGGNAFAGSNLAGGNVELVGGAGDGTANGGEARMQSGNAGAAGDAGDLLFRSGSAPGGDVGVAIFEDIGIQLTEQATMPGRAVANGSGRLWLRNDSVPSLIFTDETGADRPISRMPAIALTAEVAYLPTGLTAATRAETSGEKPYVSFTGTSGQSHALWTFQVPETYNGGDLELTIWYSSTVAGGGLFAVFATMIEAITAGQSTSALNTFTSTHSPITAPAAANTFYTTTITLTNSQLDGATAGGLVRLVLRRDADDASDTYTSPFNVHALQLKEPS